MGIVDVRRGLAYAVPLHNRGSYKIAAGDRQGESGASKANGVW